MIGSRDGGPDRAERMAAEPDAVLVFDGEGRVRASNRVARDLFGRAMSSLDRLLGPLADPRHVALDTRESVIETVELQLRSLPDRWLQMTTYDDDAMPGSRVVLIRDLTAARRGQGLRDLFPALLSHELSTPMTSIYAAAEILRTRAARLRQEERDGLIVDIAAETARLRRLVDDIAVLARLDEEIRVATEPELIERLVPDIVASELRRTPLRHISLRTSAELPIVILDRHAFSHVMRNLISIAGSRDGAGETEIVLSDAPDGGAIVRVLDRGPDEPPIEQGLLGPFGYADLMRSGDGAAVSLHVCYRLMAAMHGRIWSEARDGGGAELGIWLPPEERTNEAGGRTDVAAGVGPSRWPASKEAAANRVQ